MLPREDDLALFADCFGANGFPRSLDSLRWQYLENPAKRLFVDFAIDQVDGREKVAAIYAVFPVTFKVGDARIAGAQSLDTMTDEGYRGRGLFVQLARSVYERCAAEGVSLVYGFPNGNSAHGFYTKLGWTSLDPVPFLVKPLRTRYLAQRVPGIRAVAGVLPNLRFPLPRRPRLGAGQEIRPVDTFDERFDALWSAFSRDIPVAVQRDAEYLRWRYTAKPGEAYETRALFLGDHLQGFVTYCVKSKHGGTVGYLMELLHDPAVPAAAEHLARFAVRDIASRGADVVLSWNYAHSPNHAAFRSAGFRAFPEWARPIELHFGARALNPSLAGLVEKQRNWYVSYSDSDTV